MTAFWVHLQELHLSLVTASDSPGSLWQSWWNSPYFGLRVIGLTLLPGHAKSHVACASGIRLSISQISLFCTWIHFVISRFFIFFYFGTLLDRLFLSSSGLLICSLCALSICWLCIHINTICTSALLTPFGSSEMCTVRDKLGWFDSSTCYAPLGRSSIADEKQWLATQ